MANTYDVVIMGGGWAGNCQARHLLLNIPGIRLAIVEPRTDEQVLEDRKLGESTVEIAAMHLCKELGLHDYLIENHPPKYGLNFHWPKVPGRSETLDDYYTVWTNRNPTIAAFQIHRGKFERDLLRMNAAIGSPISSCGRVPNRIASPCRTQPARAARSTRDTWSTRPGGSS
jgi:2-polyprenyl-6-methoxyphenol hydroxylase-like FAD-dependent oxidoreductase